MDYFLQLFAAGIVLGGLYAMIALGFVLIFKATGVLNFAQGPMVVFGAFLVWTAIAVWKIPFLLALLLTFFMVTAMAFVIEHVVLRPLIGKSIIAVIMVTFGLYYILDGVINIVWGPDLKEWPVVLPEIALNVGNIVLPSAYFWGFIGGISAVFLFSLFFKYSRTGVAMRAVAENQQAALSLGVSVKMVIRVSWAISSIVAAMGGVLLANINGLSSRMIEVGLMMFPVVILGGMDSIPGAIVGGVMIGIIENLSGGYIDPLVGGGFKEMFPFMILIVILMIKPYGFFGTEEIERL
jgi:branched-chain amino acid transport system permease protein